MNLKRWLLAVLLCLCAVGARGQTPTCSQFNVVIGPFPYANSGTVGHVIGKHSWSTLQTGSCTYIGGPGSRCGLVARASSVASVKDSGLTTFSHVGNTATKQGIATSTGGNAAATGTVAAAAVRACALPTCSVAIGISGFGVGVSFPPDSIFADESDYTNVCPAESLDGCTVTLPGSKTGLGFVTQGCPGPPPGSPLMLDTTGKGYWMSDPKTGGGVLFDLEGNGKPHRYSWPLAHTGNAFLVYDRDGDDKIENGKETFGNYTEQPDHPNKNGFLALMVFDQPSNGGNYDGVIDNKDKVWKKLRLWIDEHCQYHPEQLCTSAPGELHTLPSMGIHSISLVYSVSNKRDINGNWFRFYAPVNAEAKTKQRSRDTRIMYDVYLAQEQVK